MSACAISGCSNLSAHGHDHCAFHSPPEWVRDAIFYQIFPDRFASSDRVLKPANLEAWDAEPTTHGYKGGDLLGIVKHLDWISELGANAIYLNPIFQSASNHRYHTHDYFTIDPLLGGEQAFDELLEAVHSRGMKIVLDGVFNHASRGFFQFSDILENGADSPWIDWFTIHEWPANAYGPQAPNYHAWWGLPALPKFNTDNPDVREFLFSVGEFWAAKGIDGWRLDVPEEIITPGFWEEFRLRVRAANPDLYLVAEIWGDASEWVNGGDRFDATMDYQFGALVLSFALGEIRQELVERVPYDVSKPLDASQFDSGLAHLRTTYEDQARLANLTLLDSHDAPRLMSLAEGDTRAARLAFVLLLTLPGAPCIYYGDEIGLTGAQDRANRKAFPWGRQESWNEELLTSVRELTGMRAALPSLRSLPYAALSAEPDSPVLVFLRGEGSDRAVVAVNVGANAERVPVAGQAGEWELIWGEATHESVGDDHWLVLPPQTAGVWRL